MGLDVRAEWWTSDGRIDMVLVMPEYVYVMEFKLDSTPESALDQINSKDYALQWNYSNRRIIKIGITFTSQTRNLHSWLIEA